MPGNVSFPLSDAPGASGRLTATHLLARRRVSAAMGAVAVFVCAALPFTDTGERAELRTHDARFALRQWIPRTRDKNAARIVLVTAQSSTLAAWREPTLFWGARYAKVINIARKHGAKTIGIDTVFAVSVDDALTQAGGDGSFAPDEALAQAIERANGSVVLAFLLGTGGDTPTLPSPRFLLLPSLENRLGFIDLEPAADFAIRTAVPAVRGDSGGKSVTVPSFAAVLADTAAPGRGRLRDTAPFYINYTGRDFPTISAERVASDTLTRAERESLRGAIVLIAKNYAPSMDSHVTAGGRVRSGAAIHAEAIATLLDNRLVHRLPVAAEAGIAALLAALSAALSWYGTSARRGFALAMGAFLVVLLAALGAFLGADALLPVAAPALACVLPTLLVRTARSVEEAFARKEIEATFGRHVSPEVRDYLLRSPENLRLGGKEYDATIVFFDIRGSTRYAESRDPETVVREFNELYTVAIAAIEAHGGLVNRFLGDGFLAVWGFPEPTPPDSQGSAQAATNGCLALLEAVARFNEERLSRQQQPWRVGLSLHSGYVLGGNVGVASRTEFTFMGDVVNTAAKMESLNKQFGTQMVISDATRQRLTDLPPLLPQAGFLPGKPSLPVWGVDAFMQTQKENR